LNSESTISFVLFVDGNVPVSCPEILFVVTFINVLPELWYSLIDKPSVAINVFAFALGVPVTLCVHEILFVVDVVLIILAGGIRLPCASTGISYFNPILLKGFFLVLYLSFSILALVPCLIIPSSKSFHKSVLVEP